MKITQISQCNKHLDFKPSSQHITNYVVIAIDGFLINHFGATETQSCVNYSDLSADEKLKLFKSVYVELSFVEIVQLTLLLKIYPLFPVEKIWSLYHVTYNEDHKELIQIVQTLPLEFLNYAREKKWGPQDFYILKSFKDLSALNSFWNLFLKVPASKSLGSQIFELALELFLIGHSWEELDPQNKTAEDWLKALHKIRYKQTTLADEEKSKILTQLAPAQLSSKWIRRGDKAGVEMKLFIHSPLELTKQIMQMQKFEQLSKESSLWKF